jgi:hypothetical protein
VSCDASCVAIVGSAGPPRRTWRSWQFARAFAPGALYERAARQVLLEQTQVPVATVECPVRIEVIVGSRVSCTVRTTDGRSLPAVLRLTDLDGGFRIFEG